MKTTRLIAIIIAAACLLACMPLVSASGNQDNNNGTYHEEHAITIDQANASIRAFIGDTSLEPQYIGQGRKNVAGYHYFFEVKNSIFMVNADSGVVEGVRFGDNMPTAPTEIKIGRDEAYAKAQEYINLKSDGFSQKTWALVVDQLAGPEDGVRGYAFAFREESPTGNDTVLLPNMVTAIVNPETGTIISYSAVNRNPTDGSALTPNQQAFNEFLDHINERPIYV